MKILQINSDINSGSAGRIAEDIGNLLIKAGNQSLIAYGRNFNSSSSASIKIGNYVDFFFHLLKSRISDQHGLGSRAATKRFIKKLGGLGIDLIHLHNIHGYYLNFELLFRFIRDYNLPLVWTLHDCWPFTGHCSFFDAVGCTKWMNGCNSCPNLHGYPASWLIDNSYENYLRKKECFSGLEHLLIVSPSDWMMNHLKNSFLSQYKIIVINNGIDLTRFRIRNDEAVRRKLRLKGKYILGVANRWDPRKGLTDFKELRKILDPCIEIVLVGLSKGQIMNLPGGISGLVHTESVEELAELYSGAEVFLNPTYIDNFPTTNIEAIACGTPVVTYRTGGSPESVNGNTGKIVEQGNIRDMHLAATEIIKKGKQYYSHVCRSNAEKNYDKADKLGEYIAAYENLLRESGITRIRPVA